MPAYRKHKSGRGKGKTYRMNRTVRRNSEVSIHDGKMSILSDRTHPSVGTKSITVGKSVVGKGKTPYHGKPKSIFGEGKRVVDY